MTSPERRSDELGKVWSDWSVLSVDQAAILSVRGWANRMAGLKEDRVLNASRQLVFEEVVQQCVGVGAGSVSSKEPEVAIFVGPTCR